MADAPQKPDLPELPEATAVPKSRRTMQLVWLIPLVVVLVGGWIVVKSILERGPKITITFKTAEGLEAGKTKIKYKDVEVGTVETVALTEDASKVIATAELVKGAQPYLRTDTRFWVVRPRISGGTVSGLGTLLSGSYIGMDLGRTGQPTHSFVGLEVPPVNIGNEPGRIFVLHSRDLGSVDLGSPVFFRRLEAGQVSGYALDKDGKGVTMEVFINAPYDKYVTKNTRFWEASGIDLVLNANGIKINTQSVVSILIGGLAFETPVDSEDLPPAAAKTEFTLFDNRTDALKNPEPVKLKWRMAFGESVRGLTVGAPIDFRGINLGEVTDIGVELNPADQRISLIVDADIFPDRLRERSITKAAALSPQKRLQLIEGMVENGLRAQLRTGNLITGQLYIALDYFPNVPKAKVTTSGDVMEMPTIPSSLVALQATLAKISKKIDTLPLEEIGADLHQTLQNANKLIVRLDSELVPDAKSTLGDARKAIDSANRALQSADHALRPGSPVSQDARDAMREVARAAAAFRALADYLERHPEALITGKKEEKK
jgi:paraquat-inducible protein B